MIYISSDHGGFELKIHLTKFLKEKGYGFSDEGPHEHIPEDDYPDYVVPVLKKINLGDDGAVFICRNGVGVNIIANKFKGIRAGLSWSKEHAASHRNDDDTNVLTLPADYIDSNTAEEILESWLSTPFSGLEKHKRRLNKLSEYGHQI